MTLHLLKVHLQTFLSIPKTQKYQILSCDTLVANECYVAILCSTCVVTVILLHCYVFLFLILFPFQSMTYIALTFHSACKQVVIVIVNIEHSNDLIQAVTEGVKLSKNIVLREPKGCLPRKERLIFDKSVCVVVCLVECDAVL